MRGKNIIRNQHGATAIEYALIAACVSIVIIGTVTLLGDEVNNLYNLIIGAFS